FPKSELSNESCNQMIKQLENCGFILQYNNKIIIRPNWLADAFKTLISYKYEGEYKFNPIKKIISFVKSTKRINTLSNEIIEKRMKNYSKETRDFILELFSTEF